MLFYVIVMLSAVLILKFTKKLVKGILLLLLLGGTVLYLYGDKIGMIFSV